MSFVIAKTGAKAANGQIGVCIAVLEAGRIIRPIASDVISSVAPFWEASQADHIELGMKVTIVQDGSGKTSSAYPHQMDDVMCTELLVVDNALNPPKMFNALSPVAQSSLEAVWPARVRVASTIVRQYEQVPSLAVVDGSIETATRNGDRVWVTLSVGRVCLPVTSNTLKDQLAANDHRNVPGRLVLGLSRPKRERQLEYGEKYGCKIVLVGWIAKPPMPRMVTIMAKRSWPCTDRPARVVQGFEQVGRKSERQTLSQKFEQVSRELVRPTLSQRFDRLGCEPRRLSTIKSIRKQRRLH